MRRSSLLTSWLIAGVALALGAQTVAAGCFSGNEGAERVYNYSQAQGTAAVVDLFAASVGSGRAIVHPNQVVSGTGGDFVGWGTAKGVGVGACPDDYTGWNVYVDGVSFGSYFCRQTYGQLSDTATNNKFTIRYMNCSNGTAEWVFLLNNVEKTCAKMNASRGTPLSGSESVNTTVTQNLKIHYEGLQFHNGTSWANWGSSYSHCADPGYSVRTVSTTEFWVELT